MWINNARRVRFRLDEVKHREALRIPRPIWSFALDERFVDTLAVRRSDGGPGNGTLAAAGTFTFGPYGRGRARTIGSATTGRVDLLAQHVAALGGLTSASVVAWVRRDSTAVERGVLCLRHAAGTPKLELFLSSGVNVALRARGASGDTTRTQTATVGLTDTGWFHLIGGAVDVAADQMRVWLDDAGLASSPVGLYESGAQVFTAGSFSAEAYAAESAIGVSGGIANPWAGDIAAVAVYPGVLTAEQVHALWQAGRRGTVR